MPLQPALAAAPPNLPRVFGGGWQASFQVTGNRYCFPAQLESGSHSATHTHTHRDIVQRSCFVRLAHKDVRLCGPPVYRLVRLFTSALAAGVPGRLFIPGLCAARPFVWLFCTAALILTVGPVVFSACVCVHAADSLHSGGFPFMTHFSFDCGDLQPFFILLLIKQVFGGIFLFFGWLSAVLIGSATLLFANSIFLFKKEIQTKRQKTSRCDCSPDHHHHHHLPGKNSNIHSHYKQKNAREDDYDCVMSFIWKGVEPSSAEYVQTSTAATN